MDINLMHQMTNQISLNNVHAHLKYKIQGESLMFMCIFRDLWEKKPLLLKRHIPDYNKGFFSTSEFDKILRQVMLHLSFMSEN